MIDREKSPGGRIAPNGACSVELRKPRGLRIAGRLCLAVCVPLSYFYLRDVPRALSYMQSGILPPKLNVFWLEHCIRQFYLPGNFAEKVVRALLPGSALGFSGLLLLLGFMGVGAGDRIRVGRFEALTWMAVGALLVGMNAMGTWIIWKAFVFL